MQTYLTIRIIAQGGFSLTRRDHAPPPPNPRCTKSLLGLMSAQVDTSMQECERLSQSCAAFNAITILSNRTDL
jgi:hypothetical protein